MTQQTFVYKALILLIFLWNCLINTHGGKHLGMCNPGYLVDNCVLSHVWLFVTPWTTPARLLHPWDFPGKSTKVGCHFLLQCMKVKSESEVVQSCPTLRDPMDWMKPFRFLRPWDFPGKSTGVGCHFLLWCFVLLLAKFPEVWRNRVEEGKWEKESNHT